MSKVIGTITIQFTEDHLDQILKVVNNYRHEDDGEVRITKEMVLANPNLLDYIMKEWEAGADRDVFEIWNGDGWGEIDDYIQ